MKDVLKDVMENDATMASLLTGGVHTGRPISRQNAPGAFDANGELQPCALVKREVEPQVGPNQIAGRAFMMVYFYERDGYTTIDQAQARLRALVHRQKLGDAGDQVFEALLVSEIGDLEDPALEASLNLSRLEIMRLRG